MSTHEEIMEVYEQDIAEKSYLVERKQGPRVFYCNFAGFQFERHPCSDIVSLDISKQKRGKRASQKG